MKFSLLLLIAAVAGCTPNVESRAVSDYNGYPQRLLIVITRGIPQDLDQWASFRTALPHFLNSCGITNDIVDNTRLETFEIPPTLRTTPFMSNPDAVLKVKQIGVLHISINGNIYGPNSRVKYDGVITEQPSGRAVWRGQFYMGTGTKTAIALGQQLARDGILKACLGKQADLEGPRQVAAGF